MMKPLEMRVMLSAVTRAVLAAADPEKFPLEGYDEWEYLLDQLCWLHEQLNDLKPRAGSQE